MEPAEALFWKIQLNWVWEGGGGQRGSPDGRSLPRLARGLGLILFPALGHTAVSPMSPEQLQKHRLATAPAAVHLGRISEDSDTSFPSRVSIFFTTTALVRVIVLEPPRELKLGWKELMP